MNESTDKMKKVPDLEEDASSCPRLIRSRELFAGKSRLLIEHEGTEYLLRITRHGKLILTK